MPKHFALLITLIFVLFGCIQVGFGQFNDTIFYKSGNSKVVEIITQSGDNISYYRINNEGDTSQTTTSVFTISRYVMYDEDNVLQYEKNLAQPSEDNPIAVLPYSGETKDYTRSSCTLWPMANSMIGLGFSYNLTFGKKMRWNWTNRVHYLLIRGIFMNSFFNYDFTTRLHYSPVDLKKFNWSIGVSPAVQLYFFNHNDASFYLPVTNTFEFNLKDNWSFHVGFGVGAVYFTSTNNFYKTPGVTLDVGFTKRFGKVIKVPLKGARMQ